MLREPEPPLPTPFELSRNYPAKVMAELSQGMLSPTGKTKFVGIIAACIFRYKSYPTPEELNHVGQQIVSQYPFLRSSSGSGHVSVVTLIKYSLCNLNN